ncbi:MAG: MATE family efflux transporter [Clostridiaceae bacterium]|nr:MATE family efflux transporter [Clostridiaceae bacterium]
MASLTERESGIKGTGDVTASLTEGKIGKTLAIYTLPILFSNLLLQAFTIVEALLLGSQGAASLAAVGAVFSFISLVQSMPIAIAALFSVPVAVAVGQRDSARLHRATHTTFAFCFLLSASMAVILSLLATPLMKLISVPADVRADATLYFRLNNLAFIFYLTSAGGFSILHGCGESRRPFRILVISTVAGLGLSVLLIRVLQLGVLGAGLTIVLTQFISFILVVISLFATTKPWRLSWREMTLDRAVIGETMKIALPVGFQSILYCITTTVLQSEINATGSSIAIAGYTIYSRLSGIVSRGLAAFATANQNMVGQNLGAGKYDRIRKSTGLALLYNVIFSLFTALPMTIFAAPLAGLFNSDPDVIAYASAVIYLAVPLTIAFGINEVFARMLATLGRPRFSLGVSIISLLGVRLTWIKVALPLLGTTATNVGWTFFLSYAALLICDLVYYLFFPWRPPEMQRQPRKRKTKST